MMHRCFKRGFRYLTRLLGHRKQSCKYPEGILENAVSAPTPKQLCQVVEACPPVVSEGGPTETWSGAGSLSPQAGPSPQGHTARMPPVPRAWRCWAPASAQGWGQTGAHPALTPVPSRCSPALRPTWNTVIRKGAQLVALPESPQDLLPLSPPPRGYGEGGLKEILPRAGGGPAGVQGTQDHERIPPS